MRATPQYTYTFTQWRSWKYTVKSADASGRKWVAASNIQARKGTCNSETCDNDLSLKRTMNTADLPLENYDEILKNVTPV